MMMDYFRRPQLAGRNLKRLSYATIRGARRRADADVNSSVPYFQTLDPSNPIPGIDGSHNKLDIKLDGTALSEITIPDSSLTSVLAAISTAVGGSGTVFEQDGSVYIQSNTAGTGSVEVTGGSAAPIIGFDTAGGRIFSTCGDIASAPEGRVGNPFGATWPGRGENFTMDTLRQSLSRLSGNSDVVFSDVSRNDTMLQKVTDYTWGSGCLSVGPTTRLFIGPPGGFLSRVSGSSALTPFFLLLDSTTKQPMANKVVAVTRGQTTLPVSTDTASWSGSGNVLGQDVVKGTFTISSIKNGQSVVVGSDLTTAGVVVGDLAEITGATNVIPFSNNGLRWVVQQVIDAHTMVLRPASASELQSMGQTFDDAQAIIELNDALQTAQVYGSVVVHSGMFCNGVNLLVSPPLTSSSGFELWASVPRSVRGGKVQDYAAAQTAALRAISSDLSLLADGFTVVPVGTLVDSTLSFSASQVRWRNRLLSLPAVSFDTSSFEGVEYFVYWVEGTNSLTIGDGSGNVMSVDPSDATGTFTMTGTAGVPVGRLHILDGTTTYFQCARQLSEGTKTVTVGYGGQFATLDMALEHIRALVIANGASYPHVDVVMVSDCTLGHQSEINAPGFTLRGVDPEVTLTSTSPSAPFMLSGNGTYRFRDFKFTNTTVSTFANLGGSTQANTRMFFENVRDSGSGQGLQYLSGNFDTLSLKNCSFRFTESISRNCDKVSLEDSVFTYIGSGTAQMLSADGSDSERFFTPWTGTSVYMRGCVCNSWFTNIGPTSLFILSGPSTNVNVSISLFNNNPTGADAGSSLANVSLGSFFGCSSTGTPIGFLGSAVLEGCSVSTSAPMGGTANVCSIAYDCSFTNADPAGTVTPGVGATVLSTISAISNRFSGTATTALLLQSSADSLAESNSVSMVMSTKTTVFYGLKAAPTGSAAARIVGNQIRVSGTGAGASPMSSAITVTGTNYSISANEVDISVPRISGICINGVGNGSTTFDFFSVSANRVNITTTATSAVYGIFVGTAGAPQGTIEGNTLFAGTYSSSAGLFFSQMSTGWLRLAVSGNYVYGSGYSLFSGSQDLSNCIISGNFLYGQVGSSDSPLIGAQFLSNQSPALAFFGNNSVVSANSLSGVYFCLGGSGISAQTARLSGNFISGDLLTTTNGGDDAISPVTIDVSGNHIVGTVNLSSTDGGCVPYCAVNGNILEGACTMAAGRFINNTCSLDFVGESLDDVSNNVLPGYVSVTCKRFCNNTVLNNLTLNCASSTPVTGNSLSGNANLTNCIFDGNYAGGNVYPTSSKLTNNFIQGNVAASSGFGSFSEIDGNQILGNVDIEETLGVGGAVHPINLANNNISGFVTLKSYSIRAEGNFCLGAFSIGSNYGGRVTLTGNTAGNATGGNITLYGGGDYSLSSNVFLGSATISYADRVFAHGCDFSLGMSAPFNNGTLAFENSFFGNGGGDYSVVQVDSNTRYLTFSHCQFAGDFSNGGGTLTNLTMTGCTCLGWVLLNNNGFGSTHWNRRSSITLTGNSFYGTTSSAPAVTICAAKDVSISGNYFTEKLSVNGVDQFSLTGNTFDGDFITAVGMGQYFVDNNPSNTLAIWMNNNILISGNVINNVTSGVARCISGIASNIRICDNVLSQPNGDFDDVFVQLGVLAIPQSANAIVYGPNILVALPSPRVARVVDFSSAVAITPTPIYKAISSDATSQGAFNTLAGAAGSGNTHQVLCLGQTSGDPTNPGILNVVGLYKSYYNSSIDQWFWSVEQTPGGSVPATTPPVGYYITTNATSDFGAGTVFYFDGTTWTQRSIPTTVPTQVVRTVAGTIDGSHYLT